MSRVMWLGSHTKGGEDWREITRSLNHKLRQSKYLRDHLFQVRRITTILILERSSNCHLLFRICWKYGQAWAQYHNQNDTNNGGDISPTDMIGATIPKLISENLKIKNTEEEPRGSTSTQDTKQTLPTHSRASTTPRTDPNIDDDLSLPSTTNLLGGATCALAHAPAASGAMSEGSRTGAIAPSMYLNSPATHSEATIMEATAVAAKEKRPDVQDPEPSASTVDLLIGTGEAVQEKRLSPQDNTRNRNDSDYGYVDNGPSHWGSRADSPDLPLSADDPEVFNLDQENLYHSLGAGGY